MKLEVSYGSEKPCVSFEPVREKTNNLGSDTNRAVQSQKMVRG